MDGACFIKSLDSLPLAPLDRMMGGLVVIAPHPDDETLGCGGEASASLSEPPRISTSRSHGRRPGLRSRPKWLHEHQQAAHTVADRIGFTFTVPKLEKIAD